jgi:hypothetical protein
VLREAVRGWNGDHEFVRAKGVVLKELVVRPEWGADTVSVSITLDGRTHPVWFAASEDLGREEDFLLPLALFPAMVSGSHLKLSGEVSPRLLSAVPKIQDIFRLWGDEHWGGKLQGLRWVAVDAGVRNVSVDPASGVACFFSGGVDSFYTLLKHREEITHFIFVHGFDIDLADQALRAQASRMANEVARELGKTLIEVETNLRSFSDTSVGWIKYHGAAMACVALLFQRRFRKVFIASSQTYGHLLPWGSHVLLDPLWSTDLTEIEHDGSDARRLEKVAYISEYELPMKWLRVCFKNPDSAYNCGRCGKCLAARITLRMVGALERCKTLPHDLSFDEVANMDLINNESRRNVVRQLLRVLERRGTQPELARALREALDKSSGMGESAIENAERQRLQQQLSLTHEKLERTRAKLEAARTRNKELAKRNRLLTARYSGRRYRLADAFLGIALRIPGIGKLVGRKNTAG